MSATGRTKFRLGGIAICGGADSERRVHPYGIRPRPTGRDCDLAINDLDVSTNDLLAELGRTDLNIITPHLQLVHMSQGQVLAEVGDEVDHVYFPIAGMISLVIVMNDGKAIETATIGRESMFGSQAGFKLYRSRVRAIVQIEINTLRLSASQFRKVVNTSHAFQQMCLSVNESLLTQARVTAACNALHKVEARFCRWLLQTSEIIRSDTVTLTQEFLSEMLGVRRTSVTEVATKLQAEGVISYSRGVIKIINREALEATSCECFNTLRHQNIF